MDRLKKPKDFLEKLRLTDSDYQDSGMINHIADLLERYSTEQFAIHNVVRQSEQLKCPCCDGKGIVEGEHYDDKQSCLTCNGRGYFN